MVLFILSQARILFQYNSSLFISNMQKRKQKLVKKPQLIQFFFPPSISNSYLKTEMLCCSLTRMCSTNAKMLLSHTGECYLRKSNVKQHITIENMATIFFWGKNRNPYSVYEPYFTPCKTQLPTQQWFSLG